MVIELAEICLSLAVVLAVLTVVTAFLKSTDDKDTCCHDEKDEDAK